MKDFFKKPRLFGLIILAVTLTTFFLTLGLFYLPTNAVDGANLLSLTTGTSLIDEATYIYAIVLKALLFGSLTGILLSVYSFFRNNNFGFLVSILYYLVFDVGLIVFHILYQLFSMAALILIGISIFLVIASFALYVWRAKLIEKESPSDNSNEEKISHATPKELTVSSLIFNIINIGITSSFFFVPLYTDNSIASGYNFIIFDGIINNPTEITNIVFFLLFLSFFFITVFYFIYSLSSFFSDKGLFITQSRNMNYLTLFLSTVFFLCGLSLCMVNAFNGITSSTIAFIPLICSGLLSLAYAIIKGKYEQINNIKALKGEAPKRTRAEPLIYVFLMTAVTYLSLLLNVIVVTLTYGGTDNVINMTGYDILSNYASLGSGYQILACYIIIMLLVSGITLLWTLTSYLSNYKRYERVAKVSAYLNVFMIFLLGISGLYFTIAREINKAYLQTVLTFFGYTIDLDSYSYSMRSDCIYALAVDVIIMLVMILRSSLEKEENEKALVTSDGDQVSDSSSGIQDESADAEKGEESEQAENEKEKEKDEPEDSQTGLIGGQANVEEEKPIDFDPCPAFTEIDNKTDLFKADLEERYKNKAQNATLSDLVSFVVEYARDSRLHLSYSKETMATFISGIGASRLSILQGMSGTGKTSLPKIFMEAILGDCDIVEVESSWKDKNELLGYYNEFSSMYTPRKFTQDLYKAALNREIPTFIVLDEMNLSRIEYYFSDFLSLMESEEDKREIKLLNIPLSKMNDGVKSSYTGLTEGHTLKIPTNVFFIGTANRDESTFVISDKVYDRAQTMNFDKRAPKVRDFKDPIPKRFYDYSTLASLFDKALKEGSFDAEKNLLIQKTEVLLEPYNISFGNRILKQMEEFVNIYRACFPEEEVTSKAVETILLSKVVSKLEVKTIDDKDGLVDAFKNIGLKRCAEFVSKLNED